MRPFMHHMANADVTTQLKTPHANVTDPGNILLNQQTEVANLMPLVTSSEAPHVHHLHPHQSGDARVGEDRQDDQPAKADKATGCHGKPASLPLCLCGAGDECRRR